MRQEKTNMKRSDSRVTIASIEISLTSRNQQLQNQLNVSPHLDRNKRETSTSGQLRPTRVMDVHSVLIECNSNRLEHVGNISRLQL